MNVLISKNIFSGSVFHKDLFIYKKETKNKMGEKILNSLEQINLRLESIENRLERIEKATNSMDNHIEFVEGVWDNVRAPFYKTMALIRRSTNCEQIEDKNK